MIEWIKRRLFKSNVNKRHTNDEMAKLKSIWDSRDTDLKDCAMQEFEFGKYRHNLKLNEVGAAQLVQHLAKHGFEIKKIRRKSKSAIEPADIPRQKPLTRS